MGIDSRAAEIQPKTYNDTRIEVVNKYGFSNLVDLNKGGFFSEVFSAIPKDEEMRKKFGDNVIIKSGHGKDLRRDSELNNEYQILKDLKDVQISAGLTENQLYTPFPLGFISEGNVRAIVMTKANGEPLRKIENSLSIENSLALAIQESHFFSILEATDSVRTDNFLTMKDFQPAANTYIDLEGRPTPKLQMIDWSLRTPANELKDCRNNERLRITSTLTKMVLGDVGRIVFENSHDKPKGASFSIDTNKLIKSKEFENLEPSLKYVIAKGLGVLRDAPEGYLRHHDMLNDLLACAKKNSVDEVDVPQILLKQFREVKPAEFSINNLDQIQLPELPKRKPLDQEVIVKHIGQAIDAPLSWGGDRFILYDENPRVDRYSGEELAQFCANISHKDFENINQNLTDEQIKTRVGLGRLFAAQYYIKRIFLPEVGFSGKEDLVAQATIGVVLESTNEQNTDEVVRLSIRKSIEYWRDHKNNLPETVKINTQQLTETENYFNKLNTEYN
ncbi:MAG: hypothetical protein Q7R33_06450 [Nitrosarchaeum sp.]|nr:hypothetical protein [Nitrosarchaeum sp.]